MKKQHNLKTDWLTKRTAKWMNDQFPSAWWMMTYDADGNILIGGSSREYQPDSEHMYLAKHICELANLTDNNGGAWLCGFVRLDGREFLPYMILKNFHGDILLTVRFKEPWSILQTYSDDDFIRNAMTALDTFRNTCKETGLVPQLDLREND